MTYRSLRIGNLIADREDPVGSDIRTGLCFLIFRIPGAGQVQKPSDSDFSVQTVLPVSTAENLYFQTILSN
jgi:hypothetical protein